MGLFEDEVYKCHGTRAGWRLSRGARVVPKSFNPTVVLHLRHLSTRSISPETLDRPKSLGSCKGTFFRPDAACGSWQNRCSLSPQPFTELQSAVVEQWR